jgi:hypothetical protein
MSLDAVGGNPRLVALAGSFATFRASAAPGVRIPKKLRAAVASAIDAGLSVAEVAAACDLPRAKVQAWTHRRPVLAGRKVAQVGVVRTLEVVPPQEPASLPSLRITLEPKRVMIEVGGWDL